ncbi:MAG: hypothetical protein HYS13_24520 [Planctomycetia bacterium]|nr:hypothetical protein [Planctomycetia bacterium]
MPVTSWCSLFVRLDLFCRPELPVYRYAAGIDPLRPSRRLHHLSAPRLRPREIRLFLRQRRRISGK